MNDQVRLAYNQVADNYSAGRDQFKNQQLLEEFNQLIPPHSTVLDIGCGAGIPVDKFLLDHGHQVVGLDISDRQIELAKQNLPQGTFLLKDMSTLKPNEYSVEAIVSFYAIFHTPKETHQETLNKLASYLKPGGYLLITMGGSQWEGSEEFFGGTMHWSHYGPERNSELVANTGLTIVKDYIDTAGNERHQVIIARKS